MPDAPRDNAPMTYADAGVSIGAGDDFAKRIRSHMRRTHGPRVITNEGGFAGLLRLDYNESLFRRNYKDPVLVACTDGVGTKVKLAARLGRWEGLGQDLVAMNVNDLVVEGAEPLLFLDYIATGKLEPDALERIVAGACDACARCGAALLGGETAEMPDVYAPGELDLAGFAVGVVELNRAMDSARIEPGDVVLGLASDGVHANGFSLVRSILDRADLDPTGVYPELDTDRDLGDVLLAPTRLYAAPVVRVLRRYTVKRVVTGMAHITGGGLADNLSRALPGHVDAAIDASAWQPHPVFGFLQQQGNVDPSEMRRVFNMGIGFCLIVRPTFAASITRRLTRFGERVSRIGVIEDGEGGVVFR
ncbi:MAG: phosphoribosylformylglycinamidine cyclo-ligase [Planctomycetota bacterium]